VFLPYVPLGAAAAVVVGLLSAGLFCDLGDFETINDTLGHAVGDEVLRAAARRLRASVRGQDVTARLGGDELAIPIDEQAPAVDGLAVEDTGPRAIDDPDGVAAAGQLAERAARLVTSACPGMSTRGPPLDVRAQDLQADPTTTTRADPRPAHQG
jgi:GGDEF domain-containing protein